MASEELTNTVISTLIMAALACCAGLSRLSGAPFFEPIFEVSLFYLPTVLMVCYLAYQVARRSAAKMNERS